MIIINKGMELSRSLSNTCVSFNIWVKYFVLSTLKYNSIVSNVYLLLSLYLKYGRDLLS